MPARVFAVLLRCTPNSRPHADHMGAPSQMVLAYRPHARTTAAMADHGAGELLPGFYVATRINKESIAQPSIYGYRD